MNNRHVTYRSDIDGLRAIAVLAILLFHVNENWLPGGFVGVDIFFVISGFLISLILFREIHGETFSFREFYRRRVRRIVPAYFITVAVTLLVAIFVLLPTDLSGLARSVFWSLFAAPNIFFWRNLDTSYFAPASNQIPLLHLWSLGVEEQFYLFWPLLLWFLVPRLNTKTLAAVTLALIVGSFFWGEYESSRDISFAYYMLPTRAGEFLLGTLVALSASKKAPRAFKNFNFLFESVAGVGFALIIYSLFFFDSKTKFPGLHALAPSVGTALVIWVGCFRRCRTVMLLSLKPLLYIGLISYSLYLWHWPVLAFMRYAYVDLNLMQQLISLAVIFIFTAISYFFVELPSRKMRFDKKRLQRFILLPAAALVAFAFLVFKTSGLSQLIAAYPAYKVNEEKINAFTSPAYEFKYNCQPNTFEISMLSDEKCVINRGLRKNEPRILLWGDSNAAHYVGMFSAIAKAKGFDFRNASISECPPVFGDNKSYGDIRWRGHCVKFREAIKNRVGNYDYFLMGALWEAYEKTPTFKAELEDTLRYITGQGKKAVLLGQVPKFLKYERACELKRLRLPFIKCQNRAIYSDPGETEINLYLRSLAQKMKNVTYFDARGVICRNQTCSPYLEGRPVYYDDCHMSMNGSEYIGDFMIRSNYGLLDIFDGFR